MATILTILTVLCCIGAAVVILQGEKIRKLENENKNLKALMDAFIESLD